jgi:hypothetical protein
MVAEVFALRLSIEAVIHLTCRPALPVGKFVRATGLRDAQTERTVWQTMLVTILRLRRRRDVSAVFGAAIPASNRHPANPLKLAARIRAAARGGEIGETGDYAGKI